MQQGPSLLAFAVLKHCSTSFRKRKALSGEKEICRIPGGAEGPYMWALASDWRKAGKWIRRKEGYVRDSPAGAIPRAALWWLFSAEIPGRGGCIINSSVKALLKPADSGEAAAARHKSARRLLRRADGLCLESQERQHRLLLEK